MREYKFVLLVSTRNNKEKFIMSKRTLLKYAIENKEQDVTLVMKGPLSQTFTEALNKLYAKDDPLTGNLMSGYTVGNDEGVVAAVDNSRVVTATEGVFMSDPAVLEAMQGRGITPINKDTLVVYGVDGERIDADDLKEVAKLGVNIDSPNKMVVVIETSEGSGRDVANRHVEAELDHYNSNKYCSALETLCDSFGVRVYKGFNSFKDQVLAG